MRNVLATTHSYQYGYVSTALAGPQTALPSSPQAFSATYGNSTGGFVYWYLKGTKGTA